MNLVRDHTPLHADYNGESIIIYVANYQDYFYINMNSLCAPTYTPYQWKRGTEASHIMNVFAVDNKPLEPYISVKNTGSWLVFDIFEHFGNWLGDRINKPELGTILSAQIISLYEHRNDTPDPYFCRIHDIYILRRDRTSGQINITDVAIMLNVNVKNWKATNSFAELIEAYPDCIDSSTKSTDEFGIHTSYGTVEAVLNLIAYSKNTLLKDSILEFVNSQPEN